MLVTEVRFFTVDGEVWQKYNFDNYTEIGGVKMPMLFDIRGSDDNFRDNKKWLRPVTFIFNVDYDPKIFDPPFTVTTSDAWKRKS
jgi:hypothetical protein